MPYLLLDDAADEATRRLHQFGQDQLSSLQQGAQSLQNAPAGLVQGAQSATASAQDITQRLMQYGQDQLGSLQQQAQPLASNVDDITQRLHAFGQDQLDNLSQAPQAAQSLLTPMAQQAQAAGAQALQPLQPLTPPPAAGTTSVNMDQGQAQQQPQGAGPIDSSSVQNFAKTMSPYAQYAAQALGIDPSWVVAMAGSESNYGKAAGNELFGVKALPGQKGTTMMTHEGEYGGTNMNQDFAAYDTPMDAVQAWVDLIRNHYPGAVGAKDLPTFVHGLKQGGYFTAAEDEYRNILQSIQGRVAPFVEAAGATATNAAQTVATGAQLSQFGDKQLTAAEAYAACGPAAAVRFAQMFGRQPTLREAVDLAKNVGCSSANCMAGLASESKLFDEMGIAHRTVGADWQALAKEAQSGNPVAISTPGHYFTADGYDPSTGAFHVGSSGTDLRRGSEWMTPAQMESVMGPLQGGLAADHPLVPGNSPLSAGTAGGAGASGATGAANGLIDVAGQAKNKAMQILDRALPMAGDLATGGITRRFNDNLQDLTQKVLGAGQIDASQGITPLTGALAGGLERTADTADQLGGGGLVPPDLMRAGAGLLRQPGVLDSMQTLEQLATKYGTHDTTQYTPDDQKMAGQAMLTAGGVLAGTDASRMYHGTGADFPRVDPQAVSGEENLFGPGYYLTSDPRVAGGVVARGGEQTGPSWLVSSVKREPGQVIQPGYAQSGGGANGVLEPIAGPNVRAVDVPQDLHLMDMEQPLAPEQAQAIAQRLDAARPGAWDLSDPDVRAEVASWSQPGTDGASVYDVIRGELGTKTAANKLLADAGFDGIQHAGGQRIPMTDEQGRAIQHDVSVIFPDALDKVRNAISGTQGGQVDPRFALGVAGGTAAVGALGLGLTDPDSNRILDSLGVGDAWKTAPGPDTSGWQSPVTLDDIGKGIQDFAYGGPIGAFNQNLREVGEGVRDTLAPYMPSGVLDSLQTLQDLNAKYADTSGTQTVPFKGQDPLTLSVDPSVMSPEDQQRYQQARGAVAGLATPFVDQSALQGIRGAKVVAGPTGTAAARGPIANAVDITKQFMLSNPVTHVGNTIGNTLELLRSPVALTLGGRPQDAVAGVGAVTRAIPEAAQAALAAMRGSTPASLGGAAQTSAWWQPVFKALGASDAFTRTLGEYQGMAEEASALLRGAGISANDPAAAAFLRTNAARIADAGRRSGSQSVFQTLHTASGGMSFLDDLFNRFGRYKEGLLSSPSLRDQALGALLDTQIPFAGVPSRLLQIGVGRLPGFAQVGGAVRAAQAARAGNIPQMQREIGNTVMESAIQLWIAEQIREGNIRGPDDPDHPGEMRVMGNWVNANLLGAYTLPAQIMAAFGEGFQKGGLEKSSDAGEALRNRFGEALTSSVKPFTQAVPGQQMIHMLAALGQGPGGALQQEVSDTISRVSAPGAGKFIEDLLDPVARDVARSGPASLWQPTQARIPGLAELLPAKIDPTTGQEMEKRRAGPGILIGAESWDQSPIRTEANRLKQQGYDIAAPSAYPQSVSIAGSQIDLKPDEQRQVTEITGKMLGNFADRMDQPAYRDAPDDRKALMMKAYLQAASNARTAAVAQVLGRPELLKRIAAGRSVAGRPVNDVGNAQLSQILEDAPSFLTSSSLSASEQQQALAGSR